MDTSALAVTTKISTGLTWVRFEDTSVEIQHLLNNFIFSTAGRPRVMLETASIAGGAVAALFLSLVVGFVVYVRWHQNNKQESQEPDDLQQVQNGHSNGHHNAAVDAVDGVASEDVALCCCQQSQMQSSQLSSNVTNTTNGDSSDLQHPQQQQFQAKPHVHHQYHPPPPPKRPFGPHHYYPLTMEQALMKR